MNRPRTMLTSPAGSPSLRPDLAHLSVPAELKRYDQWVTWRRQRRSGKSTKVPYNARTGEPASVSGPGTWSSFDEAVAIVHQYDGLGFVLTKHDPFVGGDLDHCLSPGTDALSPWARAIVEELNSYSETSPSGTGVRIITRGQLPPGRRRQGDIEIYESGRYLTITGRHLAGTPSTIEERTAELAPLHARLFGVGTACEPNRRQRIASVQADDGELLARAMTSRDGDAFRRLWEGDISITGGDHSAADLALCNRLAFWTDRDPERVDTLFRKSGLFRPKWDQRHFADGRTYGQATIAKAIADWRPRPRSR